MPLGRDGTAITLGRFQGRLQSATLTRPAGSAYDVDDPTAAPSGSPTTDACEGYAFRYATDDIDGTRIMRGDYRVTILRGTLSLMPQPGDSISIPPPGEVVARTATVIAVESVTEAAVTVQVRGAGGA